MDLKIISAILVLALVAIGIGLLLPSNVNYQAPYVPWQIETTSQGSITVFGLTLEHSRLQDAEQNFKAEAEISLFSTNGSDFAVEAYFDKVSLAGLSAKMTMVIAVAPDQLQAMYTRGNRISGLGRGSSKIDLVAEDIDLVRKSVIDSITYLPSTRLQADIIEKRFGTPRSKITDTSNAATHWLYPDVGLDISLDTVGNAVFQYIAPSKFSKIHRPLLNQQPLQNQALPNSAK